MARGLIAGMTDYSHQSFNDILEDLERGQKFIAEIIQAIESNIEKLKTSGYWNKLPFDFKNIIGHSLKYYKTSQEELQNIHEEIQKHVQEHHCKRLERISSVASEINKNIGKYWHNDYEEHKDYDYPEFHLVENIYEDTRDMAASLLDYSNITDRLKDFIGKTSFDMEKKHSTNFGNAQFGDNTVIVVGDHNITNPTQIKQHDLKALEELLSNNQVNQEDINELKDIVQNEEPDKENKRLGAKANGWIAKMVNKSLDGTWAIGIGAAGKLLADGIKHYYGLFQ